MAVVTGLSIDKGRLYMIMLGVFDLGVKFQKNVKRADT